jgi:hypothetical protein
MAYATVAELKNRIDLDAVADDVTLAALIDACERTINRFCNRPDGFEADAAASARYYVGNGQPYLLVDECVEISEVAVKDSVSDTSYTAWDSPTTNMAGDGDWYAGSGDPLVPDFNNLPYDVIFTDINGDYSYFTDGKTVGLWGFQARRPDTMRKGTPTVKVTAKWGYSVDVPDDIREATCMQTARWYKRFQGSMSDALASGELGQLMFLQKLDPDVSTILRSGRYIKPTMGGRW